jgi:flagellar biosynthesis protein FlhA
VSAVTLNALPTPLQRLLALPAAMALPVGIFALLALMVLPIPALLLDIFFVLNIAISIAVLMVALNARRPLDFSSFPSVLLFATLLRLALNVASTRVVLVHGHEGGAAAGHVIESFAAFLVGGNFAVGLFVFAILMIINMIVITKGAGRVSEVSARFVLDALPGKQMAIDADIAAGLITADDARERRREVTVEADFYGSMDGASKFVKGDAIAALLILGVNIFAGFALGMISHGLTAAEAGEAYVTLAVGDALVAQVPALLLTALAMLPASAGTAAATAELMAAVCDGTTDAAAPAMVEANPALPASAAAADAAAITLATFAAGTLEATAVAKARAKALAFGRPAMALATAVAMPSALEGFALIAAATASLTC